MNNTNQRPHRSVMHLHVHVIPRYVGDMEEPMGGVRELSRGSGVIRAEGGDWINPNPTYAVISV
ncbi:MAG: hypothetical protein D5R96_06400 [Methanocalculus sp. MSAO_Arc2]|nr:MAG: hypothetical protein D5R96_06400 [Methanocalculus sp. MSAO_Arc2]